MGFCFEFQGKVFGPVDNGAPLFCIAGPRALESRAHALEVPAALREIFAAALPFVRESGESVEFWGHMGSYAYRTHSLRGFAPLSTTFS